MSLIGLYMLLFVSASTQKMSSHNLSSPSIICTAAELSGKLSNAIVLFMENRGQILDQFGNRRSDILFLARQGDCKIAIMGDGIFYQFQKRESEIKAKAGEMGIPGMDLPEVSDMETYRLDMKLIGANPNPIVERGMQNPYLENYYNIPTSPEGIVGVRAYEKITLKNVYPGIDWVIYSNEKGIKYDFVVHPGADPSNIRIKYEGAVDLFLNRDGGITVKTPLGEIEEGKPVTFSGNQEIESRFVLENAIISFSISDYDHSEILVIDPSLLWATYYGGSNNDIGNFTAVDGSGNVYLAGQTESTNAIASGGHQNTYGGGNIDAFLVKFNSAGTLLWGTYYGGSNNDVGYSTAVDGSGNVYLSGFTSSSNAIASGGHQNTFGGSGDAFLAKFNSAGTLLWGTYYG